jgi:hypothetical protein
VPPNLSKLAETDSSKLPELMPEELRTAGYSLGPLALKNSLHIEFYGYLSTSDIFILQAPTVLGLEPSLPENSSVAEP